MNVMMVRAKLKEENVADAQAATEKMIQALEQAHPDVRYAATRLSDGVTPARGGHPAFRACWTAWSRVWAVKGFWILAAESLPPGDAPGP
jgi:hypothetical protein